MITFLLFVFGSFFVTIALVNVLISWWIGNILRRRPFSNRSTYNKNTSSHSSYRPGESEHQADEQKKTNSPKAMVSCAYCQTYCPKEDALYSKGHYFCGESHLQLFEKK